MPVAVASLGLILGMPGSCAVPPTALRVRSSSGCSEPPPGLAGTGKRTEAACWQAQPHHPLALHTPGELQPGGILSLRPCIPQGIGRGARYHTAVVQDPGAVSPCRHLSTRWGWYFGAAGAGSVALGASALQNPMVEEASSLDPVSPHLWGIFWLWVWI